MIGRARCANLFTRAGHSLDGAVWTGSGWPRRVVRRWMAQAMIDGVANYAGDPGVEARCRAAVADIDAAIDDRLAELRTAPDASLLSVMTESGCPTSGFASTSG
jgi:hypothetical protein